MPGDKLTRAIILSAGFGTRLKPFTDTIPKPLIMYDNKPLIEHVIGKLIREGISDITINTHYLHEKIEKYFKRYKFSAEIHLKYEKEILGTGGGIKNSRGFLKGSGSFLVHNADVISEIDITTMYTEHLQKNALATLAVKKRNTSRPLLIDENNNLTGRVVDDSLQIYKESPVNNKTAFSGVYILSDRIFNLFPVTMSFDIIPFLLDMVKNGEKVICYDIGSVYWKDIGRIEDI